MNVFYDRGELVKRAVGTVASALAEATVLVIILLLLFLGDLRASLTVAVVLPLSALGTFILMRQFGMSANLMSLGGLAIAIGMLVDSAIVVVENITTHIAEWQKEKRLPRLHVFYRAVREVAMPVASGISIIIIVFFPLLTLQGLEGKLFTPVALTIVFALACSLLLSLTVIPVLSSFLLTKVAHSEPWLPRKLEAIYVPVLRWCLGNAKRVTAAAVALLAVTAVVYVAFIGKSFMPTMDEGDIIVQLEKLPSITLEKSVELDLRVQEAILARVPEVQRIVARVGSDEIGMDPMGLNETDVFMVLRPKSEWRMDTKDESDRRHPRGARRVPGHRLRLYPADRDAGLGDADRRARRRRRQAVRARTRRPQRVRVGDRRRAPHGGRQRGRVHLAERRRAVLRARSRPPDEPGASACRSRTCSASCAPSSRA